MVDQTHREVGKQGGGVLGSSVRLPMHAAHKQRSVRGQVSERLKGEGERRNKCTGDEDGSSGENYSMAARTRETRAGRDLKKLIDRD